MNENDAVVILDGSEVAHGTNEVFNFGRPVEVDLPKQFKTVQSGSIVRDNAFLRNPSQKVKTVREGLQIAQKLWAQLDSHNKRIDKLTRLTKDNKEPVSLPSRGIGLAAPQIGILKRVCIISYRGRKMCLINPTIAKWSDGRGPMYDKYEGLEGCLSLPGQVEKVFRYGEIEVHADNLVEPLFLNAKGTENQMMCSVAQHEIAHLSGKLIDDFTTDDYPAPTDWDEPWTFKVTKHVEGDNIAA